VYGGQGSGVLLAVKENEAFDPMDVAPLGSDAEAAAARDEADLVEQWNGLS